MLPLPSDGIDMPHHHRAQQGATGKNTRYKEVVRRWAQLALVEGVRLIVYLSSEDKLDLMNDRLASIERMLKQSRTEAHSPPSPDMAAQPVSPVSSVPWSETRRTSRIDQMSTDPTPAGDTGTTAESVAAKNVLEQTVGYDPDPAVHQDSDLRTALESLRGIVHRTQLDATGAPRDLTSSASTGTASPTLEQAEAVLERLESESA